MANNRFTEITINGLWKNNPVLVQLLGLCPLLAVTASVVNALGLGLATMFVLTASNIAVSLIRNHTRESIRLPVFVMVIASFTTTVELLMQAYTYELYEILGIFIPLIVTNCAILGRADAFASKNGVLASAWDGAMTGLGFLLVLVVLGACRELIGQGTLFAGMDLLLGPIAANWTLHPFSTDYPGLLLASLPPGAFLIAGALIALKNYIDASLATRTKKETAVVDRRVRTTGNIK